jgi:uncharacterized protein
MAYIDTSVLVAYYCQEPLSTSAQKALAQVREPVLSPLVEVEFCSALAMKVRMNQLGKDAADGVVGALQQHIASSCYKMIPLEAGVYRLAGDLIRRFSVALRAPDAIHLATASVNGLQLLTADKELAQCARHFGVRHRLIS